MIKDIFGGLFQLLFKNPHLFTLADNPPFNVSRLRDVGGPFC